MTSICSGGGPSSAKAGFGLAVTISASGLAARFANTASWLSVFIAGFIGGVAYELSTFCATDPPTLPTLTAQDFVDLIQPFDFFAKTAAVKKINDWIGYYIWFDVCQCNSGTQPTPTGVQTAPTDLPTINPPSVIPVAGGSCGQCCNSGSPGPQYSNASGTPISTFGSGWGAGTTAIILDLTSTPDFGGGWTIPWTFFFTSTPLSNAAIGPTYNASVLTTDHQRIAMQVPAGANCIKGQYTGTGGTSKINRIVSFIDLYCGPQIGVQPQCCGDQGASIQIQEILELVTLIQRQIVPFAYVPGTAHAGLTGSGTLSVSGLIGVKIDITTDPSNLGIAGSSPEVLFDRGYFTWGTADGYPQSERLERTHQLSLPARASAFTELAYDLHPGVTVTITELVREA